MQAVQALNNPITQLPNYPSVFNLRDSLESIFNEVRAILTDIKQSADANIKLAACAELRKTVALAKETLDAMLKTEAITAVEQAVLQALEEATPRIRAKVMSIIAARSSD